MQQSRIRWSHLDEATFNELVETLLVREFSGDGLVAMAIDGRGGDGGIDIDVRVKRTDQLVRIFQLKHFPEGFSGGFVKRREQIKRSLTKALAHKPPVWTLVVPRNVTNKERQVVRAMRKGHDVRISFVTPTEMNALLAKHPDIEERFSVDRAVELLRAVNREEAALARPGDLHSEVSRITDRLNSRSEYWGTSFAYEPDGSYTETYFPKRPDALKREPLGANVTLGFTKDDERLKVQWESAMKFGTLERIVLPTRVIHSFEKTGPDWFREVLDQVEIHLGPNGAEHQPMTVRLEARDDAGRVHAVLRGKTTSFAHGFGGYTFDVAMEGGLNQRWILPLDHTEPGTITFSTDFEGHSAREVRRALRFTAASSNTPILAFSLNDAGPTVLTVGEAGTDIPDARFAALIDDVCALEDHFDVALRLPREIDSSDFIWARIMRMVLEGSAVAHPYNGTFGGTLDGTPDETLEALIREGNAILIEQLGFGVELFGEPLEIERVRYYAHHATVDDAEQLNKALADGKGAGMKIALRPIDGLPWLLYAPPLSGVADEVVIPQPWGIEGIREHPGFSRLPQLSQADGR
ncbi:hypothetical protein F6W70_03750 [Microbacterium maritypicum]|uniref:Uncharacterized protein n=1 Tax=Microbacterium maritypicum TaxID=33918 RepID=A0AAD3X4X9_MICMQ|nr:hypothetical protein [Microbacterium liquefaciens]KAB1886570.1 hypothetical protein F6W70_03750 [Microbacterium liquefaciens]